MINNIMVKVAYFGKYISNKIRELIEYFQKYLLVHLLFVMKEK